MTRRVELALGFFATGRLHFYAMMYGTGTPTKTGSQLEAMQMMELLLFGVLILIREVHSSWSMMQKWTVLVQEW